VRDGTTVLLTTQYLDEADALADRIAVIDHGAVIAEGTPSELKASLGSGVLHVRLDDSRRRAEAEALLTATLGVPVTRDADPAALSVPVPDPESATQAMSALAGEGLSPTSFSLGQPSLDEVFLALTDRQEAAA